MQVMTRRAVMDLLRRGHAHTRSDLAQLLGLSRSSVAQTVSELVAEGLLTEQPADRQERRGRPSTRLQLVSHPGWVAAVDLSHEHISVIVGDLDRTTVDEIRRPWPVDESGTEALLVARKMVTESLTAHKVTHASLAAVGLSVPFPVVDSEACPVEFVPGWVGVRPADVLNLPRATAVLVDNDANMAAWGEFVETAAPGVRSLIYLMAGEGVGGGLVIDGGIFRGTHGISGEVGHVRVTGCRLTCRCGRTGCLDALVQKAHHTGDPGAVRQAGEAVGTILAQLSGFVDPDLVVLGGVLGDQHPQFTSCVQQAFIRDEPSQRAVLATARLGLRSALWGAFDWATQEAWSRRMLLRTA